MAKKIETIDNRHIPINFKKIKTTLRADLPTLKFVSIPKLQTNIYFVGSCFHPISRMIEIKK